MISCSSKSETKPDHNRFKRIRLHGIFFFLIMEFRNNFGCLLKKLIFFYRHFCEESNLHKLALHTDIGLWVSECMQRHEL